MDPDPALIEVMVRAAYPALDEMNPTQQAFARANAGMMLLGLAMAGYQVVKKESA